MKKTLALLICCALSSATHADANWYASATLGLTTQSDQRATYNSGAGFDIALDSGIYTGGALGFRFASNWRAELEFAYQSVDRPSLTLTPSIGGDGNYASTAFALNLLHDFRVFEDERASLYLGAGVSFPSEIDIDFESGSRESEFSSKSNGTGFQLMGGVRRPFAERWMWDLGLKVLRISDVELDGQDGTPGTLRLDYEPLSVSFGLSYWF
jgi:opacity protein-like surface antigen